MRSAAFLASLAAVLALAAAPPALARDAEQAAPPAAASRDDELARLRAEVERLVAQQAQLEAELKQLVEAQAGQPGQAGEPAAQAEIQRLREELRKLQEAGSQAAAALEALSEAERRRVNLTVYGDFQARAFEGEDAIFDGKAFELVMSGQPHERLSFFAEIEFEQAAAVGEERGGEVLVEQAYANLSFAPLANLRAGILLVPFGNVNVDHFAPRRDVVGKPLVSWVVAPSDWTDNGVGFHGSQLVGSSLLLSYEAYAIAGLDSEISAYGLREARQGYGVDNNGNKALVGRLVIDRSGSFELGLSGYTGDYDDAGSQRLEGLGVHGLANLGPLHLTGEYNSMKAHGQPDQRFHGYYGRATIDFGRNLLRRTFLGKGFSDPRFTLVYQHDWVSAEGLLEGTLVTTREQRDTVGLNFRPSSQWVLKLDYEWNRTDNLTLDRGDRDGFVGAIAFVF